MSVTIVGGSQEKAKVARLQKTTWWAENGLINCMHPTEGHSQMSVKTCLLRAKELSDLLGRSTQNELIKYADLRKEIQNFLDDIVVVCQLAREQGTPDDPNAQRDKARRRPASIIVP